MKYTVKPHKDKISSGYAGLLLLAALLIDLNF